MPPRYRDRKKPDRSAYQPSHLHAQPTTDLLWDILLVYRDSHSELIESGLPYLEMRKERALLAIYYKIPEFLR